MRNLAHFMACLLLSTACFPPLLLAAEPDEAVIVTKVGTGISVNESAAIAACKTYAEAQDIYRRTDWDGDGILEYSQSIKGANSLYEKTAGTGNLTLVDAAFAKAEGIPKSLEAKDIPEPSAETAAALAKLTPKLSSEEYAEREGASTAIEKLGPMAISLLEKEAQNLQDVEARARCNDLVLKLKQALILKLGFGNSAAKPKAGYCFKVLTGQGPNAPGGKKSYIVAGAGASANSMTLGYGLIAFPANYGVTGRNTFIINNTGTVYQKDLGKDSLKYAMECTEYNPDATWTASE